MPTLLFQIFYRDDPNINGVDFAHGPTLFSIERSEEFWAWAADHGFPSGLPGGDPDAWVNVVESEAKGPVEAHSEREFPVSRREMAAFREAYNAQVRAGWRD